MGPYANKGHSDSNGDAIHDTEAGEGHRAYYGIGIEGAIGENVFLPCRGKCTWLQRRSSITLRSLVSSAADLRRCGNDMSADPQHGLQ